MTASLLLSLILGLGVLPDARADAVPAPAAEQAAAEQPAPVVEIEVRVKGGYHPARVVAPAGAHVRLRFVRDEYTGCTREVVFPTLDLRRELPTGEPVVIDLGVVPEGGIPFHCGMKMSHGVVVVDSEV